MKRYSMFALARGAAEYHVGWERAWRDVCAKAKYDTVVVGGGAAALATAYYLAKRHGYTDVAVIAPNELGEDAGVNPAIIETNAPSPQAMELRAQGREMLSRLAQELNFNMMFSARGILTVALNADEAHFLRRRANLARAGENAEWVGAARAMALCSALEDVKSQILGAMWAPLSGVAHLDAAAWAYARAADDLGVDILQNHPLGGLELSADGAHGLHVAGKRIEARQVILAPSSGAARLFKLAGEQSALIAEGEETTLLCEPLKPFLDVVVKAPSFGVDIRQSNRGELAISAVAPGGSLQTARALAGAAAAVFPRARRVRAMRMRARRFDQTPDAAPLIGALGAKGVFYCAALGREGAVYAPAAGMAAASLAATGGAGVEAEPFTAYRFKTGALLGPLQTPSALSASAA